MIGKPRYKRKKSSKVKGQTKSYGVCLCEKCAWDEWSAEDWNNFFGKIESRLTDALNILGMVQVTQKIADKYGIDPKELIRMI